jgi:2-hydroxymuconate-semialdehyde hydrolase
VQAFAPAENFVDVTGTRIRFLDAGSGPPLLLVHGLGQSSTAWRRCFAGLASERRVIAPDLPGFGGSDKPADVPYDPHYFTKVARGFVNALGLGRIDAVGHSAGALVLLLDALEEPQRYRRLVLADPVGFSPAPDNLLGAAAASLMRLLVSIPRNRALTRALYATAFFSSSAVDEETVDELDRRRASPQGKLAARRAFEGFFHFCQRLAPFHERLRSLETPSLVVWGSDDRLFRISDSAVARRVLSPARIETFERCGHCPQIEFPDRFAKLVLEFLAAK